MLNTHPSKKHLVKRNFQSCKKAFLLLVAISLAAFTFAQSPSTVGGDKAATQAQSTMDWTNGTSHDFGKIAQNKPASYTFEFKNTGTQPVTITKAQPSCSCTVPEYTKEPVLPGKKGYVKATYNAHSAGAFNKAITVTTDGDGGNTILKITGEVIQKAEDQAK